MDCSKDIKVHHVRECQPLSPINTVSDDNFKLYFSAIVSKTNLVKLLVAAIKAFRKSDVKVLCETDQSMINDRICITRS